MPTFAGPLFANFPGSGAVGPVESIGIVGSALKGQWVCMATGIDPSKVIIATPTNLAAAGVTRGIAIANSAGGVVLIADDTAVVDSTISGLSSEGAVGIGPTAFSEIVDNPSGAEFIGGNADNDGNVTVKNFARRSTSPVQTFNPQAYSNVPLAGTADQALNGELPDCTAAWDAMVAEMKALSGPSDGFQVDMPPGMIYTATGLLVDSCIRVSGRGGGGNHPNSGVASPAGVSSFIFDNGTNSPNPGASADFAHIENITLRSQCLVKNVGFGGITHTRAALTKYTKGFCCFALAGANPNRFFRATTGGTTAAGGDPAAFATAIPGQTIVDGTVTWTCEAYVRPRKSNHLYAVGDRYMNFGPARNPVGIPFQPGTDDDNRYYYECTVQGTSDANPLNVPTLAGPSIGVTFTDGTATFVAKVHNGITAGAPFTWDRLNISGYTNAMMHLEGTTPTSVDLAGGDNVYGPIANGMGLYIGTSEANGIRLGRLFMIDTALFLDDLDADMVTNLGGHTLYAHSQGGINGEMISGQVSNGRNIMAVSGNNVFDSCFSENGLPDLGAPGTTFIGGTRGPGPVEGVTPMALGGPGGNGQCLEENDRRGTGTPGLILTHGLTIQDGYTIERFYTNQDSPGEFWRLAYQWVSNPNPIPGQAGTGWWGQSFGSSNYNPSIGYSGSTALQGGGFFRLYYGKFTGLETETIAWDGYAANGAGSDPGNWGLTWKQIRGGHFLAGDRVEFLDKVTPGTWRRTLVQTAGYRGQAWAQSHLYFGAGSPIGYPADMVEFTSAGVTKVFRVQAGGTSANAPHAADFNAAATPGVSTVTDGTVTWLYIGNAPGYVPWGFIDDPVIALTPQAKTRWADTADTDPATAAPHTLRDGDRIDVTTPDNSANQVVATIAIPADSACTVNLELIMKRAATATGGSAKLSGTFINNGGTVTRVGTDDNTSKFTDATTCDLNISGTNVQARVSPGTNASIGWGVFYDQGKRLD